MNFRLFLFLLSITSLLTLNAYAEGSVSGVITFEGKAPRVKTIRMDGDAICLAKQKDPVYAQTIVLGEGNTLGNVFVYIRDIKNKKKYPVPTEAAVLDQKGCNYSPHVQVVRVGQKLRILNPDGTLHNVHAQSKINPEFNASMPDVRKEMEKVFNKPEGMFAIRCDVHPWMLAWMAVMDHPYYALTGKDGKFQINDIPPGEYELEIWQEKLGTQKSKVLIKDGSVETINFTFSVAN